jgi:putative tricarboxylic transport membrane protein
LVVDAMKLKRAVVAVVAVSVLALSACAQVGSNAGGGAYPSRTIELIIPYGAGGGTDLSARILADQLKVALGQEVVVRNVGGGGGAVGLTEVFRAKPDGYTLGIGTGTNMTVLPNTTEVAYKPNDFAFVGGFLEWQYALLTNRATPVNSVEELQAWAATPGNRVISSETGGLGIQTLGVAFLASKLGFTYDVVPSESGNESSLRLLAGDANVSVSSPATNATGLASGDIKPVVVMSPSWPELEQKGVRTTQDLYGFSLINRNVLIAPPGTPDDVMQKLEAALKSAMADPGVQKKINDLGNPATFLSGADAKRENEELLTTYGALIDQIGLS